MGERRGHFKQTLRHESLRRNVDPINFINSILHQKELRRKKFFL